MKDSTLCKRSQQHGITVTANEANRKSGVIYRASGNIVIVRETQKTVPHNFTNTVRGAVTSFSPGAGRRMRSYLRSCIADYKTMVTLTYPGFFPLNGKICKEHLRRFLQELRREYCRVHKHEHAGTHSSFWFLEFQERGAPHFHIFTTWAPNKEWVADRWYYIVGSDDKRHLAAGTRTEFLRSGRAGTISYASKYAQKAEQKEVPENFKNVGRFWGIFGRRGTVSADAFVSRTESDMLKSKSSLNSFWKLVNQLIFEGKMEVLVRERGVAVLTVNGKRDQIAVRAAIHRISASVMRFDSMFLDAELDYGDSYGAELDKSLDDLTAQVKNFRETRNQSAAG